MNIEERIKKIRLLLLDVDGVLTDGRIIYDTSGRELKLFNVYDGMGVHLLNKQKIPTIIITAKASRSIKPRAKDMGVKKVYDDLMPKSKVYEKIKAEYGISEDEVCFIGDDLVDISAMKLAGFAVAVNNACEEVKQTAHYITKAYGGKGAVREVSEIILKSQNKWDEAIKDYV
ncbi:MAG: HAD-IIIA family hydrolase [Candidatus Gygaella obscura]|nr:HAD-IIIA family hydrolase [Candidatus Gygaella obscura]